MVPIPLTLVSLLSQQQVSAMRCMCNKIIIMFERMPTAVVADHTTWPLAQIRQTRANQPTLIRLSVMVSESPSAALATVEIQATVLVFGLDILLDPNLSMLVVLSHE